jgi:hypothetical protein
MAKRTRTGAPPVRTIGEAASFHVGIDWLMAALLFGAAIAAALYFRVPWNFDFQSRDFNPFVFVPIVLGGFGLKFFVSALLATLRARRYGEAALEVEGEFVAPGETLRGRVRTATDLAPARGYELRLRCIEAVPHVEVGSSANRGTYDRIRWEATLEVPSAGLRSSAGIPFEFALPADVPVAGDRGLKGQIRWTLDVRAPGPGLDFATWFGVDVRRRPVA